MFGFQTGNTGVFSCTQTQIACSASKLAIWENSVFSIAMKVKVKGRNSKLISPRKGEFIIQVENQHLID